MSPLLIFKFWYVVFILLALTGNIYARKCSAERHCPMCAIGFGWDITQKPSQSATCADVNCYPCVRCKHDTIRLDSQGSKDGTQINNIYPSSRPLCYPYPDNVENKDVKLPETPVKAEEMTVTMLFLGITFIGCVSMSLVFMAIRCRRRVTLTVIRATMRDPEEAEDNSEVDPNSPRTELFSSDSVELVNENEPYVDTEATHGPGYNNESESGGATSSDEDRHSDADMSDIGAFGHTRPATDMDACLSGVMRFDCTQRWV